MKNWKKFLLLGFVIVAGASVLRFVNLNSLPIFADESIYVRWSQVMRSESNLRFLPLSDGKQPLYMWAVIPALKFFTDPLIAGRVVSGLSGLGLVAGIGLAVYLLYKNLRLSVIASLLAAVLPYFVFFNRMALADSMLVMFLVWSFNFSILSLQYMRWDFSMLAGFALGFAWLTKSPAIFALVLLPLNLLLIPNLNRKKLILAACYLLTTFVIAFGMYNILRLGPEFHMIAIRNKDYVFSATDILMHPLDPLKSHLRDSFVFYWYLASPLVVGLSIWGLSTRTKLKQKIVLTAWLVLPIIAQSLIAKQFTARYLLFTVPFAVILAALGLENIGTKTKKHFLSIIALGVVLLTCLSLDLLLIYQPEKLPLPRIERAGYLEEWTAGYGIRQVSQFLSTLTGPVVVGSEGYFGTPFDGLQVYLNHKPNVRIVGVGVWIDRIDEKLTNALAENQVFLVVNSSRLKTDWRELPVELIASYPKAISPAGIQEELYLFKVLPE